MATFNGARFVEEQLASFSAQTVKPAELVVCDDGSTDRTLELVEGFARSAPFPVRIERNERQLGISDNFLKAASLCSEAWIAFSDQDDVWAEGKLRAIADALRATPGALLVAHRAALVDEHLVPLGELLHVPSVRRRTVVPRMGRSFWSYPYGFTMTFSARLVRDYPFPDRPVWSHDRWICILASVLGETVLLPEPLASYRRHGSNASVLHPPSVISADLIRSVANIGYAKELKLVTDLAGYFAAMANVAPAHDATRLADAAKSFQVLSGHLALRESLGEKGIGRLLRAYRLAALAARGAYRSHRHGGLGLQAGAKDCLRLFLG